MNHSCEYLLTAYYLSKENVDQEGELYVFRLNKNDLKNIVLQFGGMPMVQYTNLAKSQGDLDDTSNDKEYAIRPKFGDKCWQALLAHRVHEFDVE